MSLIIGLVGEKGSGKGTFAEHLREVAHSTRVVSVRFSTLLRETLDLWHLPPTRANLQKIAVVMDDAYGIGTLSNAIFKRVSTVEADIVVLDGVRWDSDVTLVRRFPRNLLVYVTAEPTVRFERLRARGEKSDERDASFEQFMREEQAVNETGIPRIGATADHMIRNEGDIEAFREAIVHCYRTHCLG